MPRGSRPSIAALTIAGATKAIDSVMLICRRLQLCRCARPSIEVVPVMISSSRAAASQRVAPAYFRRRRVRLRRFAFAATRRRYRRTISSPEAPASKRVPASKAASTFSVSISSASRRACLPPRISFSIRSPTTWFASTASFIRESNTCPPLTRCRQILPWSTIGPRTTHTDPLGSGVRGAPC